MVDERFKLPSSSLPELMKIISAYMHAGTDAVSLTRVSNLAGIHETQVSRNTGFLVLIGILEGGRYKKLTERGHELALAADSGLAETIQKSWWDVVEEGDFFQRLLSAVKIRNGMDETTFISHVAYTAGQPKSARVKAGASAIMQMLLHSGALAEEDGKLVATNAPPFAEDALPTSAPTTAAPTVTRVVHAGSTGGVSVSVQVRVACTVSELAEVGVKLRELLRDLSKPPEAQE